MVTPPQAIIFDLDGTIIDSQEGILHSFHRTLDELGRRVPDGELRSLIGPPLGESFARLGFAVGEIPGVVARYRQIYSDEGVDRCVLYDGVVPVLRRLGELGIPLALATAKRDDFARRILVRFEILGLFDVVAGSTNDNLFVTKRETLGGVLDALGVAAGGAWMIGDRREDMTAAASLDLVPVGVLWGYGTRRELIEAGARHLCGRPGEILSLVAGAAVADRAPIADWPPQP